jgi:hypothetical protein
MNVVLPADQEMIPARNAIDAHAQDFFFGGGGTNDEFLLPILEALALHATRNAWRLQTALVEIWRSYQ